MYLREMGSVELSREDEIALWRMKRVRMMIGGICESPLAIRALLTGSAVREFAILARYYDLDLKLG